MLFQSRWVFQTGCRSIKSIKQKATRQIFSKTHTTSDNLNLVILSSWIFSQITSTFGSSLMHGPGIFVQVFQSVTKVSRWSVGWSVARWHARRVGQRAYICTRAAPKIGNCSRIIGKFRQDWAWPVELGAKLSSLKNYIVTNRLPSEHPSPSPLLHSLPLSPHFALDEILTWRNSELVDSLIITRQPSDLLNPLERSISFAAAASLHPSFCCKAERLALAAWRRTRVNSR